MGWRRKAVWAAVALVTVAAVLALWALVKHTRQQARMQSLLEWVEKDAQLLEVLGQGRVPSHGWETNEYGGYPLALPLILYPGAEVQGYGEVAMAHEIDFAVLLGTYDSPYDVAQYYQDTLTRRDIPTQVVEVGKNEYRVISPNPEKKKVLVIFIDTGMKGPPKMSLMDYLSTKHEPGDETKIALLFPVPEQALEESERIIKSLRH